MTINEGYSYRHVVGQDGRGHTVLSYLASAFRHSTFAEWNARCASGEVLLAEGAAAAEWAVRPGDVIVWNRPPWVEAETPRHYEVIHHDDDLLAVAKPSGLPTLPGGGYYRNTLLSLVREEFPDARPLHRLGRGTSGLVLFALSGEAASTLQGEWSAVQKHYRALAAGVAWLDEYDIRAPIGRRRHPRLGDVHAASARGKPSRSRARVLARRRRETVFDVALHTGRPHQIRIHLAAIGHPLVGDPLYAVGGRPKLENPGLPGDGGYWLHAHELTFAHPADGRRIHLTATPPEPLR